MADLWTDRAGVVARYSESVPPGPSIYEFRRPERDWVGYVLDLFAGWEPGMRVLDAGCGWGAYLPGLRSRAAPGAVFGLDLTFKMLRGTARPANPRIPLVNADVQLLPMRTATVDVVLSAHMLYHVPDVGAALREFRRVLRPGGALLAIYDSEIDNQPELDQLFMDCGGQLPLNKITNLFSLESAPARLNEVFDDVTVITERPEMLVPTAQSVVREIDRLRPVAEAHLRPGVTWEQMVSCVGSRVVEAIRARGAFRVSEHKAVFICR